MCLRICLRCLRIFLIWPTNGEAEMDMTTLTIDVRDRSTIFEEFARISKSGEADATPRLTFLSAEMMADTLTPGRWRILEALTGAGETGVRELARRVGRDVKGVHRDAQALVSAGVIDKTENGKLLFPYSRVHVEFTLEAAG